jgi:hypothetical protein
MMHIRYQFVKRRDSYPFDFKAWVKHNGHPDTPAKCLHLLAEGSNIRSAARILGTSKTTILKLIVEAGRAAVWYQDRVFRDLKNKKIQVDEVWGLVGARYSLCFALTACPNQDIVS